MSTGELALKKTDIGNHSFIVGDAETILEKETRPGSIDCTVTSPPYFALRSYGDNEEEIGREVHPDFFSDRLYAVFMRLFTATAAHGTLWVVIGDSFSSAGSRKTSGYLPKNLLDIPGATRRALQRAGWIVRSEIIWHKPNGLPEAAKDRPSRSHETIIMVSKSSRYFFDLEALRECGLNRTVWTIRNSPSKHQHTAAFPIEIPAACIAAGCPKFVCLCGVPWARKFKLGGVEMEHARACGANRDGGYRGADTKDYRAAGAQSPSEIKRRILARSMREKKCLGWFPQCACHDTRVIPGTVLDPFAGTGTTGVAAEALGRASIQCDLYSQFIEMAKERMAREEPKIRLDLLDLKLKK